ncbi:DUF6538 domain-containing protein [Caballeronia sp. Sq4a]|uniref:DUF6538 domain-containing protein n=1 Tax=Caballeronia sp. Sq4a TaxID=2878152 RepID=UPI0020C06C06|nr:DUF6538 domain-containing protein [Caballeronia sp. Sq4a]
MSVKLIPHPSGRSRNWYVDIFVPLSLQAVAGTGRVRRSTGTADRVKARAEGARIEADLRATWLALKAAKTPADSSAQASSGTAMATPTGSDFQPLESPPVLDGSHSAASKRPDVYDSPGKPIALSPALIRRICAMRMADWEHTHHFDRAIKTGDTDNDRQRDKLAAKELARDAKSFSRRLTRMTRTVLARGQTARAWRSLEENAREYAEDAAYLIAADDPLLPDFVLAFAETERSAQETFAMILSGKAAQFDVPESSGALLSAMIPVYEKHKRGAVESKSISKSVSVWKRLIAFVGDVPLGEVSAHDIYRFLEDRLHAENKPWGQTYVSGFAQRTLREFFGLARTHGHMSTDNPMNQLETTPKISKEEQRKREKRRYPFTAAQLNKVFASDWYDPNARHWSGGMATDLGMRYWGPIISLCHGFRVRELTQLVNSDFAFCDGILLVTVQMVLEATDDPALESTAQLPLRTLKNESAVRTVPVHPQLCALGFADFVREKQALHPPGTPLFPSAIPDENGEDPKWGRAYEQAFLRHVRDRLAFGPGHGNHSFRHLFEDRVRDAQVINGTWPVGLGEFFSGRRLPRAADKAIFLQHSSAIDYGDGYKAEHVQRYIAQITFEGVVFPTPYAEWLARRAQ